MSSGDACTDESSAVRNAVGWGGYVATSNLYVQSGHLQIRVK